MSISDAPLSREILIQLAKTPLFGGLAEADLRLLLAEAHVESRPDGHLLYSENGINSLFFIVLDGYIEIFHEDERRRSVVDVAGPLSLLGEAAMFGDERHGRGTDGTAARVVGFARLLVVPAEPFRRAVDARFDLAQRMLCSMAVGLRRLVNQIAELKLKSTAQRLGGFLLGLAPSTATGRTSVRFPYDKRLAAEALGMTAESLSRALLRLGGVGVESHADNRVEIADLAALRAFCGEESP